MIDLVTLGRCTSAFFGGRAEGRVVRVPLCSVGLVDAQSMYSLVNANLGTWQLLTAREVRVDDCTEEVRQILGDPLVVDRCLKRQFWRDNLAVTAVELDQADGIRLPVRAAYDPRSADPGIGLNPIRYQGRLWYMLADVVAGVILGGPSPSVSRAFRLVGVGTQPGLRPVALRGGRTIKPTQDDPFVVMVEERQRIKADPETPQAERDRLDRFLKITGSATAYGVLARFDRREVADSIELTVYGPNVTPLMVKTSVVEEPGPFCFPPIAAAITSGARLMLALLELLVHDEGGSYAFCDTDSMAIICSLEGGWLTCPTPDGAGRLRVLSWPTVREILGRFADLNPFDATLVPSLWKVEHDSLAREMFCYVISAKRYLLYRATGSDVDLVSVVDEEADTEDDSLLDGDLVDWSEHGLGLYLDPTGGAAKGGLRDGEGRRIWIREGWTWVLRRALGGEPELPGWVSFPAVTRFTISNPTVAAWFVGRDAELPFSRRMRPGSFGLIAHPDPFLAAAAGQPLPAAPFETDPHRWLDLPWYDRRTGKPIRITTTDPATEPERLAGELARGDVRVRTLGDVLHDYARRPEHKSLAPDGSHVTGATVGKLRLRPVESHPALTILTGKEGNKLVERLSGELTDPSEYRSDFGSRDDPWRSLVVPVLRAMGAAAASAAAGCSRRAVERAICAQGATAPHGRTQAQLADVAAAWARSELGAAAPAGDLACLYALLNRETRTRTCACGCRRELQPGQRMWRSEACRKRAARQLLSRRALQGPSRRGD